MRIAHKTFGLDLELPEILQGALETFERELEPAIKETGDIKLAVFSGVLVRAASKAGWLTFTDAEVAAMKPGAVTYLSRKITEAIQAAREVPPE